MGRSPAEVLERVRHMEIGWIAAIVVGGIAGWLAEQFMKSAYMGAPRQAIRASERKRHLLS